MEALGMEPSTKDVEELISKIDMDGNGTIDILEFIIMMINQEATKDQKEEELVTVFKAFDMNGDGTIDPDDLVQKFKEIGDDLTQEDALKMLQLRDAECEGTFDFA